MPIDYTNVYAWARDALRETDENLTDEELALVAKSSARRLLLLYPQVRDEGGSTLTGLSADDRDCFDEACGYLVAARWIIRPRPEGEEIVVKSKIAQLEEVYQVADLRTLLEFYREECRLAISGISFISDARREAAESGAGMPKIVIASKARHQATLDPNAAGPLAMLFSSRQENIIGDDFDGDGLSEAF